MYSLILILQSELQLGLMLMLYKYGVYNLNNCYSWNQMLTNMEYNKNGIEDTGWSACDLVKATIMHMIVWTQLIN